MIILGYCIDVNWKDKSQIGRNGLNAFSVLCKCIQNIFILQSAKLSFHRHNLDFLIKISTNIIFLPQDKANLPQPNHSPEF